MALLYAPSAWAVAPSPYTVDNTGDADGLACSPVIAGDCSLRSAITLSNASTGVSDTINFDPTVFTGSATSTILVGNVPNDLVVQDPVTISGGDCDATAGVKPCVRLAKNGGTSLLTVFTNNVSISGIAFTGASGSGINAQGGFSGLSVTGSWFGVGLDGTTLSANDTGISLLSATNTTIGGNTATARNVFADNSSTAMSIAGTSTGNVIKGNYLGTLPDGSAVANPGGVGISMQGNNSGATIGGDATTAGQCGGECNLIDNFTQDGIRTTNAGGSPSGFTISGNFIGLGLDGTSDRGNGTAVVGGSGIDLDGSSNVTIGGSGDTKRNFIAGNSDGGVRAITANSLNATNNYIGLSADGNTSIANTKTGPGSGSGLDNLAASGSTIQNNRFGGNGVRLSASTAFEGNVIGVGPSGQDLGVTGEPGLELNGNGNTVGSPDTGDGNTIGNVKTAGNAAIFLTQGSSSNFIQGNLIGTTSTGVAAPNVATGILLGGNNSFGANLIGGSTPESENVISNSGADAIAQTVAQGPTQILRNVGKNNGSGANDLFIDLGTNGPGNAGGNPPNNGILAPANVSATTTSISGAAGSARPGASIFAYATYTSHGDIRTSLGSTGPVGVDGSWTVNFASPLPNGVCVTANQTDSSNNSSEMAVPVPIGGGSGCVPPPPSTIDTDPTNAGTTADNTPTFAFSSTETGVSFECKLDAGSFAACPDGTTFTPSSPLADGSHQFQERAVQNGGNPALSPELGVVNTRTFTVDTTGPVITFTSGPGEGATIDTSSASIGFSPSEPGTFVCKLDGGSFGACSSPFAVSSLAEGAHTVQIRGTDDVGNVGGVATRNFSVQFPVVTPPAPPGATGQRAAALKKCKKKKSATARKKCKKNANKLPV